MDQLRPLKDKICQAEIKEPPLPWRKASVFAVGGLESVGFDRESEHLLVVSSQGRGVFDCRVGKRVARDDANQIGDYLHLEAQGIGPLDGKVIRMAGLYGGGLPLATEDRWSLEIVTLNWPATSILLFEPDSWLFGSLYGKPDSFHKIALESEVRACGFSASGRSLVIATSSDLTIFVR
ncbi:hypothetical protein [Cupriavidus sp. YAF13]|uniref:hypothetical protein n=1 Tax=Cupriavidus sp. YAF13 TaxID=3233075 RepID=UPI003F9210CF